MSDSLSGRVAVVTGAARGIGDAIAERLLADGARVFSLDKAAPTEPRDGVVYLEADVAESASVAAAFTATDAESGRFDILVNNAGIQRIGLVGKVSFADWSAVIATHLNGFFLCASEAVPRRAARGAGSIVSIASPRRSSDCRDAALIARPRPASSASPGAVARSRDGGHSRQRRRAGFHANQIHRAGARGRFAAGRLDDRSCADEAAGGATGNRERGALARRLRSLLYDRPDNRRGRRPDGAGHSGGPRLAEDADGGRGLNESRTSNRSVPSAPSPQLAPPPSLSQRKSSPSAVKVALSLLSLP